MDVKNEAKSVKRKMELRPRKSRFNIYGELINLEDEDENEIKIPSRNMIQNTDEDVPTTCSWIEREMASRQAALRLMSGIDVPSTSTTTSAVCVTPSDSTPVAKQKKKRSRAKTGLSNPPKTCMSSEVIPSNGTVEVKNPTITLAYALQLFYENELYNYENVFNFTLGSVKHKSRFNVCCAFLRAHIVNEEQEVALRKFSTINKYYNHPLYEKLVNLTNVIQATAMDFFCRFEGKRAGMSTGKATITAAEHRILKYYREVTKGSLEALNQSR